MSHNRSSRLRITLLGILAFNAAGCAPMHANRPAVMNEAHPFLLALFAPAPIARVMDATPRHTPVALFASPARRLSPAVGTGLATGTSRLRRATPKRDVGPPVLDDDTLRVVRGRVGAYKRIVTLDDDGAAFDARAAILAREMDPRLPRGTELVAVYDTSYDRDGEQPRLLALQVGNGASAKRAFRIWDDARDVDGFYTSKGRAVEARFLRYPLDFMLVTSPFSQSRKHPILKKRRPHLGVDLAAPYGTPVMAVADGDVVEASWAGSYGRTVGIRHDAEYATGYSHLDAIAPGIVPGARVLKGEVIGFVGRSGLTTGPHLHFSMARHDALVDPLTTRLPQGAPLEGTLLRSLRTATAQLSQTFARAEAGREQPTRVATRARR
jgi:murein DD-endopeptidase MepM/ murein hydrolase activator NlpD